MDFILKIVDFILQMVDFILEMLEFILKMADFHTNHWAPRFLKLHMLNDCV